MTAARGRVGAVSRDGVDRAARIVALVVFALVIYVVGYKPALRADGYFEYFSQSTHTIRAANDGHPFAAYSPRDPSRLVRLDELSSGYYDPGLPALISLTSLVGRTAFGDQFKVGRWTIYQIVFGLCVLAALVFVCPALPLPVSLGALAALAASILIPVYGRHAFDWPRWWQAYGAVLAGMLVVGLLTARGRRWRPFYFAGLAILAACSRLFREEVVVTTYAVVGALFATLLALWVAGRWSGRTPLAAAAASNLLRRAVLACALFGLGLAASPYVLRAAIAAAWGIPFAETATAVHGSGHSLYLSLGQAPNPYGISWRDNVAMSHSHLIDPTVRVEDARYQAVLRREALRIMLESPWLVYANVTQNLRTTVGYLAGSAQLRVVAVLAAVAVVASLSVLGWHRRPSMFALWGGLVGLAAGASAPAILIDPEYLFGAQAVVMLLAFVAPAVTLAILWPDVLSARTAQTTEVVGQYQRAVSQGALLLVLASVAIAGSACCWYAIRVFQHGNELAAIAASPQPLADLEREGYRYARFFNELPVNVQERLIAEMAATNSPRMAASFPPTTIGGFRPVLAVQTGGQLHVIAWLGKEQPVAAQPFGSALTFVGYCVACEHVREDLPNDAYSLDDAHLRLDVAGIHNKSWADHYYLLTIPTAASAPLTGEFAVILQSIMEWNAGTYAFTMKTEGRWPARFR